MRDKSYKWWLLAFLFVTFFLEQGTRQIYNAALPQIKLDFAALGVTDTQLGLVGTVFSAVFGLSLVGSGFAADFPQQMARLCNGADYLLPNLTEAAFLLGQQPVLEGYDKAFIERTIAGLHKLGAKNVILTGVSFEPNLLGTAVSDGTGVRYDFNPRLLRVSHGTGDVYASVFAGAVLRGLSAFDAAALAADIVCRSIELTEDSHWYGVAFELALPDLVDRPSRHIRALLGYA